MHILLLILSYCGSTENSNAWLLTGLSMKVLHIVFYIQKDFINWDSSSYQSTVPLTNEKKKNLQAMCEYFQSGSAIRNL